MGCVTSADKEQIERLKAVEQKLDALIENQDEESHPGSSRKKSIGSTNSHANSSKSSWADNVGSVKSATYHKSSSFQDLEKSMSVVPTIRIRDGGYDVFISHSKKIASSEDRAVWAADLFESMGFNAFFDRSDLAEITEPALAEAMLSSDVCITVIDPVVFHSHWVFMENRIAYNAGIPILPIYDADRYRWQQIEKWAMLYPWAFQRQTVPISKDRRHSSVKSMLDAVTRAKEDGLSPPPTKITQDATHTSVKVGAGGSRETETWSAVQSAYKSMLTNLGGASPSVVVATFTCTHDAHEVVECLQELCPDVPMVGCTTCRGVVLNSSWLSHNKEFAVGMWCLCDDGGTYVVSHIDRREEGPEALQQQVRDRVAAAMLARQGLAPSFVVLLGSPGDEEIILEGIQAAAGEAVPILGGSSADNAVTGQWRQIAKQGISSMVVESPSVSEGGIALLVAWATCEIATTLTSGFRPTRHRGTVTEVDKSDHGRTIMKIDGKPAVEVYEQWTGGRITKDLCYDAGKACILAPSSFCPLGEFFGHNEKSYVRVMHPAFVHQSTGALTSFADAHEGMEVVLLDAAPETLAKKISQSARQLMGQASVVAAEDVVGALMIFCGGLVMAIDEAMPLAAEQLGEVVAQRNVMGLCCFGEQGMSPSNRVIHGNLMFGCLHFSNKPAMAAQHGISIVRRSSAVRL